VGQKYPSAGAASHARYWEKAEEKPLKADIVAVMSPVEGTAEVKSERREFACSH
jgi:hypothetical protein